ncbi:sulfatase [Streptomyces sp. NPDC008313]|uniref:sulfatase n=1 Tax=Streptomyces sp. NPDC008313 TaxID=3364826 RepID=UPI0036E7BA2C
MSLNTHSEQPSDTDRQTAPPDEPAETDADAGTETGTEGESEAEPEAGSGTAEGKTESTEAEPAGTGTAGTGTAEGGTATAEAGDAGDAGDGERPAPRGLRGLRGLRERYPEAARVLAWGVTGLCLALVFAALLLPNDLTRLTPARFVRIPAEGVLGAALLLALPPRGRRWAAVAAGAGLGLLTLLKFLDMGFYWALDRPFDLVLDWILLDDAESFLKDSIGSTGATLTAVAAVLLALAVLALTTLAVVRISNLMVRHRHTASRTLLVLGIAWMTCSVLSVEVAGVPMASRSAAALVERRVDAVRAGLKDEEEFAKVAAVDAYGNTPPDRLLTGLRGKDVIFAFIESYGRSAIDDPAMASQIGATLKGSTAELEAAGFSSRSAYLRSPVAGAGSWLAHSTFLSGLWIKNQQRYRNLTSGDRMTLTDAFRRTGAWRTVGIMPGVTRAWPEGKFFGLDHIYDSRQLGYQGPKFSWSPVPDQYSLSAFERLEHGREHGKPLMSEIILTSSHNPWAPIPRTIGWDEVGDGSVYDSIMRAGKDPKEVWKDPARVRDEYRRSIQYSVTSLTDYVARYGDKNTVLVFLGDHQPNRTVTGDKAGRDVPVAIVAHDRKVLDRISGWGWSEGLKPGKTAPEWRMDTFRDRFLGAYGSEPSRTK